MKLTDEQYIQVFSYVDGEMTSSDQKAFEVALAQNKELYEEVEFYKEIRLLSESVEQKICMTDPFQDEKKKSEEKVWGMLSLARRNWEKQQEEALKSNIGIIAPESPGGQAAQQDTTKAIQSPEAWLNKANAETQTIVERNRKRWEINTGKWLAAAILIGLVFAGIFLWLSLNQKEELPAIGSTVKSESAFNDRITTDQPASISQQDSALLQNERRVLDDTGKGVQSNQAKQAQKRVKDAGEKTYTLDQTKQQVLFADNFKPDSLPVYIDGHLEKALAFYNNSDYTNAISAFNQSEALVKRGIDERAELRSFYTYYYKGLIYMAMDSTAKALVILKKANSLSPDPFWKSKARWYLALAYLKIGNLKKTEGLLQQLVRNDEAKEYRPKAMHLLKQLTMRL